MEIYSTFHNVFLFYRVCNSRNSTHYMSCHKKIERRMLGLKVGSYQIGRYHAIIKKYYEDGSVEYETQFSDEEDLNKSLIAIHLSQGKMVGIGTDNPKILTGYEKIRGKEEIIKELNGK